MSGNGRTWARSRVVAELAAGSTVAAAAKTAGVAERTIRRWLAEPAFKSEVDAARAQMVSDALGRLSDSATAAARALRAIVEDNQMPPGVRVSAARNILEMGTRLRESVELEQRIAALEGRGEG
jgi:lambda repressor-like predicted transcriptional regulator